MAPVWSRIQAIMPTARGDCAATVVGDKMVVVVGDYDDNDNDNANVLATAEAYSTTTRSWTTCFPSMRTPRSGCVAVTMGHRVYVTGGSNGDVWTFLSSVEMLYLRTRRWPTVASVTERWEGCVA
mmetsp:Transcript_26301/g.61156  ORF Transcript_26301/g.61156 Transcript_26301/m.61156 type:complete len:125 (+) Transcript_26301:121-495(+)